MRRTLFTILACTALFVAVPAVALAHEGQRGHHHKRHHHSGVRHEKFLAHRQGANDNNGGPTTGTEPTAGTVTSFANNVLTITLTNGNTVSGQVTNDTEVKCESPAEDNNGDDNDNQGDDNGNDQMCAITPGMAVSKAELTISGAGAFWDEVELASSSTSTSTS